MIYTNPVTFEIFRWSTNKIDFGHTSAMTNLKDTHALLYNLSYSVGLEKPQYEEQKIEGKSEEQTFSYKVSFLEMTAIGVGISKVGLLSLSNIILIMWTTLERGKMPSCQEGARNNWLQM